MNLLEPIQADVTVRFRFDVHFTEGVFSEDNPLFWQSLHRDETDAEAKKILFVVEEPVERYTKTAAKIEAYCRANRDKIALVCPPLIVPGGEGIKNSPEWVTKIQSAINDFGVDRHSYVGVVGGGATLDAVGFAAATAHRGIRLIRFPTTVLSQDDSGVGVKNAINAFGKKNWVGSFATAWAVLNDFDYLKTLPDREWRGGISEAVKVALIKDLDFFRFLEENADALKRRDMEPMKLLIRRCAALHVQHICTSGDAFEMGSSRPLDFGHWAAHKLEQITGYALHHGEAVAVGIALDVTYSYLMNWITLEERNRVMRVLSGVGLELFAPELTRYMDDPTHPQSVLRGLQEFREHLGGRLTIQMLRGLGDGFNVHEIDDATMQRAAELLEREANEPKHARPSPRLQRLGSGDAKREVAAV